MTTDIRGPLRTVPVDGATYGYHQFGSGPDLVLLNGDAMCMSMWTDAFLSQLASSWTVTIFDYAGMGQSTAAPQQSWLIPDMAHQTADFLGALGLTRPALVGWSTGGEIALQMAVFASGSYSAVVTVGGDAGSPHYVGDPDITEKLAKATPQELVAMIFPADQKPAMQAFVADLMSRPQDYPTPEVMAQQDIGWRAWLAGGIWDELASITARTLVISGELDALVDVQNARNIAARIPGAQLEVVPDAGHAVLLQEPEQMAALITEFARGS